MHEISRFRLHCAAGALALALAWPPAARAQPAVPSAPLADEAAPAASATRIAALRRVPGVCAADVARFCPELAQPATSRNQVICLRPYKFNLALGCRGAVAAASH